MKLRHIPSLSQYTSHYKAEINTRQADAEAHGAMPSPPNSVVGHRPYIERVAYNLKAPRWSQMEMEKDFNFYACLCQLDHHILLEE
jgi:hypothetical protein